MINDLRYDFNYALIEEYKTYWDGFQDPNDPYCILLGLDESMMLHFKGRKQHALAVQGATEKILLDQNTLWFVTYANTLKALSCINDINEKEISLICEQNRWLHNRKIVNLKDNNTGIDPLYP